MADTGAHVIQWNEGWGNLNEIIVFKHFVSDFKTSSVLFVRAGQIAVVYDTQTGKGHPFREGRHEAALNELNQNHLTRSGIGDKFLYNEKTSYPIDVYFVNATYIPKIEFGTKLQVKDKNEGAPRPDGTKAGINYELGLSGVAELQVADPLKLIGLVTGATNVFTAEDFKNRMFEEVITQITTTISSKIDRENLSWDQVQTYTAEFAAEMRKTLTPFLDQRGFAIKNFAFNTPKVRGENIERLQKAKAAAAERWEQGYTYQEEQAYGVMGTAAGNKSAGMAPFMGAGMGIGMGLGMGGAFGAGMANVAQTAFPQGQMPNQMPPQGYYQQPQGQMPPQGYYQQPQGQMPPQGAPVPAPEGAPEGAPAPAPAAAVCPKCGQSIQPGATVCGACGQQLA